MDAIYVPPPAEIRHLIEVRAAELRRLRALLRVSARADAVADLVQPHETATVGPGMPPATSNVAGK